MSSKIENLPNVTASETKSFGQPIVSLNNGMAEAKAGIEQTQAQLKEGMDKAGKTAVEAFAFSQETLEAFARSGQIWSAGLQDLSRQLAANMQASIEATMNQFKALTSVKSLQDAIDLQSNLVRGSTEKAIAETTRLTTASIKLTEEAMAPITARMSHAAETFTKAA